MDRMQEQGGKRRSEDKRVNGKGQESRPGSSRLVPATSRPVGMESTTRDLALFSFEEEEGTIGPS